MPRAYKTKHLIGKHQILKIDVHVVQYISSIAFNIKNLKYTKYALRLN